MQLYNTLVKAPPGTAQSSGHLLSGTGAKKDAEVNRERSLLHERHRVLVMHGE